MNEIKISDGKDFLDVDTKKIHFNKSKPDCSWNTKNYQKWHTQLVTLNTKKAIILKKNLYPTSHCTYRVYPLDIYTIWTPEFLIHQGYHVCLNVWRKGKLLRTNLSSCFNLFNQIVNNEDRQKVQQISTFFRVLVKPWFCFGVCFRATSLYHVNHQRPGCASKTNKWNLPINCFSGQCDSLVYVL